MIREAASVGQLSLQLAYFRGGLESPPEGVASAWTSDAALLATIMARVECRAGQTQIARVLAHAQRETLEAKVGAVVFIGDACEQREDNLDRLGQAATALGKLKTPVFAFQEGREPDAERAFRKIAEWSGRRLRALRRRRRKTARRASQGGRAVGCKRDGGLGRPEGRRKRAAARSNER
jgi:hypothetical protein